MIIHQQLLKPLLHMSICLLESEFIASYAAMKKWYRFFYCEQSENNRTACLTNPDRNSIIHIDFTVGGIRP
jgi:hypothetical protein